MSLLFGKKLLKKASAKLYSPFLKTKIHFRTWMNYDRHNEASLYPFKLIWIDAGDVEYYSKRSQIDFIENIIYPQVQGGDWDKNCVEKIENHIKFRAFEQRFEKDLDWEETKHYQNMKSDIEQGEPRYFCRNINELNQYFSNIDDLYDSIKSDGYLEQSKIENKSNIVNNNLLVDHFIDEINEVIVNIGRNGEIFFEEGRHRFYIAKLLNLKIPVRVLVRHEKWQKARNRVRKDSENVAKNFENHPDIKYLVQ